jgi:maleate isomerase
MITKRVGVVVPSLNVVVEDDLRRELPEDVGFHLARVRLKRSAGKVTQADLFDAGADAVLQAGLLADARMDAIAFNCTGASLSNGPEGALKLRDQIAEATGTKATTTILSVVRALKAVGITRMVHVCPFTAEFAIDEANFLKASGLEVVASRGLNFNDAREAAKMTPEEIGEIAAKQDVPEANGIFLSCANVRAVEATAAVARRLGKPVMTSNAAVMWDLLDMIGHPAAHAMIASALPERARAAS